VVGVESGSNRENVLKLRFSESSVDCDEAASMFPILLRGGGADKRMLEVIVRVRVLQRERESQKTFSEAKWGGSENSP